LYGDLVTTEYAKECLQSEDNCRAFQGNPSKFDKWNAANSIRKELQSCLDKPYEGPGTTPLPLPQAKECKMETFEGHISQGGVELLQSLFRNGYKVSIETEEQCEVITNISDNYLENFSKVRISGYKCEE